MGMGLTLFDLPRPIPKAPAPPLAGTGIPLRYYQREDADTLMDALSRGHQRPCCVAATGTGKGATIAEVAGRLRNESGKVLCVVDRAHLVHQLADEIERHLDTTVGRVADGTCEGIHRAIVVSTVQAMFTPDQTGRPLYEYPQFREVRAIVPDEAHRFLAPVYRSVSDYFVERNRAVVVGFTATPSASNGEAWSSYWDWTATQEGPCMRTTRWAIDAGYLVPMRQAFVRVNLDLAGIYEQLDDAVEDADEEESDDPSAVLLDLLRDKGEQEAARFAAGVADVIQDRTAIIFSPPRVKAAQTLASWLKATGRITADAVWGSRGDKSDVLGRFKRGLPQALSNAQLLCEGFDNPYVSCVCICRPLKAWRLAAQMVGRGLRVHPSIIRELGELDEAEQAPRRRALIAGSAKPDALIVDLVGIDGAVLQASAIDVLYADEPQDVRRELGEIVRQRRAAGGDDRPDAEAMELARQQVAVRQREELAEMARQRGMAGELPAQVSVTYDGGASLPSVPAPIELATEGERARFVAYALQYDVERAVNIANSRPRNVLRGMTASFQRRVEAEGKRPDWHRARAAFPNWANQKRRAS